MVVGVILPIFFFDGEKWKGTELQWNTFKKYGIEKGGADRFNLNIYTTVEPEGSLDKLEMRTWQGLCPTHKGILHGRNDARRAQKHTSAGYHDK